VPRRRPGSLMPTASSPDLHGPPPPRKIDNRPARGGTRPLVPPTTGGRSDRPRCDEDSPPREEGPRTCVPLFQAQEHCGGGLDRAHAARSSPDGVRRLDQVRRDLTPVRRLTASGDSTAPPPVPSHRDPQLTSPGPCLCPRRSDQHPLCRRPAAPLRAAVASSTVTREQRLDGEERAPPDAEASVEASRAGAGSRNT